MQTKDYINMRLNEKTYPAFNQLERGDFLNIKIDAMFGDKVLKTANEYTSFINALRQIYRQVNKKYYLTSTFKDAITTALPKIMDKDKHINEVPTDCGIIFTDKGFSVYLSNPTDKLVKLVVYGFTRDCLTTYGVIENDGMFSGIACSMKDGKPYDDREGLANYLNGFLVSLYFIHNCEIEQKILEPNQKSRDNGQKHFNESKSAITILDCKWFTELIINTPFNVSGHFRWQVHGERFSKRKLIWIADFEKHGYHRKATKQIL